MWEEQDLLKREGVKRLKSLSDMYRIAHQLGYHGPIEIRNTWSAPMAKGRELIIMTKERRNLILVHEIAHVKGGGTVADPHNKNFVWKYIGLIVKYFHWDEDELLTIAYWRGLI